MEGRRRGPEGQRARGQGREGAFEPTVLNALAGLLNTWLAESSTKCFVLLKHVIIK